MAAEEDTLGSIVNKRALPVILLILAGLFLVLTFAVGWFTIDATLRQWDYDGSNPPDYTGTFIPPLYRIDLQMHNLRIATEASPTALQDQMEQRGGEPTYDEHAGRMGTIMLGMLMMQLTILLCFAALAGFYALNRRGKRAYTPTVGRLFNLFTVLALVALLYFAFSIGRAARNDEEYILSRYSFNDQVAYVPLKPDIGFWKDWKSEKTTITLPDGSRRVWQFEVQSNPSAGFWLTLAALGCVVAARVVARRNGEFEPETPPSPPAPTQPAPG